ncbi:MAG: type 2 isopentenyl-diphosphate Delta-isomerase [Thermoplasmata archaeon]
MIENRKLDHVNIVIEKDVNAHHNYWDDVTIIHQTLPEINYDEIDLSTDFLGRRLKYPIIIESMTGGFPEAKKLNETMAKVAAELQIGMGVGSERVLLKNKDVIDTFSVIKEYDIPLRIANIGAPQLINQKGDSQVTDEDLSFIMDALNAHFLDIHLNFLQEVVQPEGDRNAKGIEQRLYQVCRNFPVIIKETGAGIDYNTGLRLKRTGALALDVAGVSGTSFAAVEYYRAKGMGDKKRERLGQALWDWGIPSPVSVIQLKNLAMKIIASGGIRNGIDVSRALILGADLAGMAGHVMKYASLGYDQLLEEMEMIIEELKAVMFLTGSKNIEVLQKKKYIVQGQLKEWLSQI